MQIWVFVLVVLVATDGEWRDWGTYPRLAQCEEVVQTITRHREDSIQAHCEARLFDGR